jgi:hypothetical protein
MVTSLRDPDPTRWRHPPAHGAELIGLPAAGESRRSVTPDGDNFSRSFKVRSHDALEERAECGVGHYLSGNGPPVGDAAIMAPSVREGRHDDR